MAKIIEASKIGPKVARLRHECGALVEFEKANIRGDQRDGDFVECPACKKWIAASLLSWQPVEQWEVRE